MKLLITGAFKYNEKYIEELNADFFSDETKQVSDPQRYNAVVCNGLFLYNEISKFTNLKFIQLTSAGLDRVPLDYIKEHNIQLFNAKGVYSIPMAEWVILKILEIYKQTRHFETAQKNHEWTKCRDILELNEKTATIVGVGSVGSEIAKRLKSFGVSILGVDVYDVKSEYVDKFYLLENINEALKLSDIVILTLPLTDETKHLFDNGKFNAMKDGSVLVNVSRGGIIKEDDLVLQLKGNKFSGVALDVFEKEPLESNNPLWEYENVFISPHNSFVSDNVNKRMFELIYRNVRAYSNGDKIINLV